jgi:hypothetical protein
MFPKGVRKMTLLELLQEGEEEEGEEQQVEEEGEE